jgi:hypothetical protein
LRLDRYPLLTKKYADFMLFKEVVSLMKQKEHLNLGGLKKILAIKASINLGFSNQLNEAFPDIVPVLRPTPKTPSLITDFN